MAESGQLPTGNQIDWIIDGHEPVRLLFELRSWLSHVDKSPITQLYTFFEESFVVV